MEKAKNWTHEENERLKEMFKQGASDEEIAAALGRSTHTVHYKRAKFGLFRYEMGRRWTDEEIKQLKALFAERKTDREIALAMGRQVNSIFNARHQHGLLHKQKAPNWTQKENEQLLAALDEGMRYTEIARMMGRSPYAVHAHAQELGLPVRKIRRFTPEEITAIKARYDALADYRTIAREFNRSPGMIRQLILKEGWKRDNRAAALANRYGIDPSTIDPNDPRTIKELMAVERERQAGYVSAEETARIDTALNQMTVDLAQGMPRRVAMRKARLAGATLDQIGKRVGLTRERIRQLTHNVIHANTVGLRVGRGRPPNYREEHFEADIIALYHLIMEKRNEDQADGSSDAGAGEGINHEQGCAAEQGN